MLRNFVKRFSTVPNFTRENYFVTRGNYNTLEDEHIYHFMDILKGEQIVMDLADLEKYNIDWFKSFRGSSRIVLKPKTTNEVSKILEYCNNHRLAICPQGGNTGVVGGCIPIFDEIILSMELLNKIEHFDENTGALIVEAGCILANADDFLASKGYIFPLDLGARGSCQIGGNLATNASGLKLLKYGSLHGNVLGIEVVKPNGEVLNNLNTMRKDNTGYHLKNLFIGSEGTLGVITKAVIACPVRPSSYNVGFVGCQNFDKVLKTFRQAKIHLGEILSAFEVMDSLSLNMAKTHLGLESPIGDYPFYILFETAGSNEDHDKAKVEGFLEKALNKHWILNGLSTSEPSKMKSIWSIRDRLPECYPKEGYVFPYDMSLPLKHYFELVEIMREHMGKMSHRVFGFGHLGDGNLHLQISVRNFSQSIKQHIEPFIFEKVKQFGGSISAEHGMGFSKAKYIGLMKSPIYLTTMRNLKRMMDPNGILNPYKVFP